MKLYTSIGPNPRVVKTFCQLKGLDIPTEFMDVMKGENRQEAHLARNPAGESPCLELDNGAYLSEITAICEYLEELHPQPPLIGTTPEERAETRMWTRRIDLSICEKIVDGFRSGEGLQMFQAHRHLIPQAADDLKAIAREKLTWLDPLIAGKTWICGERFTLADILLFSFLDFAGKVGQPLPEGLENLAAWQERARDRIQGQPKGGE